MLCGRLRGAKVLARLGRAANTGVAGRAERAGRHIEATGVYTGRFASDAHAGPFLTTEETGAHVSLPVAGWG